MSEQIGTALLAREQLEENIDRSRLIGGVVDIPGLTASAPPAAGDLAHATGTSPLAPAAASAGVPAFDNPAQGAQLITGIVDIPGLSTSATTGTGDPYHAIGTLPRLPTVGAASTVSGPQTPIPAEGGLGTVTAAGQLHQLVTAMVGFGGDQGSAITNLTTQNEVESARTSLAASLHFTA
jgi:hypothetical protein